MFTSCSFDEKEKNLIITEEKIVLKNYVELKKSAIKIINYEKKK